MKTISKRVPVRDAGACGSCGLSTGLRSPAPGLEGVSGATSVAVSNFVCSAMATFPSSIGGWLARRCQ